MGPMTAKDWADIGRGVGAILLVVAVALILTFLLGQVHSTLGSFAG